MAELNLKLVVSADLGSVSANLSLPSEPVAVIALAHGAGTDMNHHSMQVLSDALVAQDIATFRYNFPYMEKGSRRPDTKPVATATVRAAVAAAAQAAPDLPIFAGGRSFGGRMSSLAVSQEALPGLRGLIFFAFPLHPAGKPGVERADHLSSVNVPMLFLQGPRDELATPALLEPIIKKFGTRATLHTLAGADHGFKVLKSSGRTDAQVLLEVAQTTRTWIDKHK